MMPNELEIDSGSRTICPAQKPLRYVVIMFVKGYFLIVVGSEFALPCASATPAMSSAAPLEVQVLTLPPASSQAGDCIPPSPLRIDSTR